jgi:MFS family permease
VRSPAALLVLGPLVGFFGTGYFSGFGVIASELFPTAVRGSAMGFVYNIGRVLSAAAPYMIGASSERWGLSAALSTTAGAFLVAAVIATALRLPDGAGAAELA